MKIVSGLEHQCLDLDDLLIFSEIFEEFYHLVICLHGFVFDLNEEIAVNYFYLVIFKAGCKISEF